MGLIRGSGSGEGDPAWAGSWKLREECRLRINTGAGVLIPHVSNCMALWEFLTSLNLSFFLYKIETIMTKGCWEN